MQRTRRQFLMMALLMGLWAAIRPAAAQYTSNYQTNIISGATSYWPGDYVVGSNTFADALLIRNGGVLTNADGYAGYLPISNTNFVMVAGAGSAWSNANLYFGYNGNGNTLVITNGGNVANSLEAYVAYNTTSSNNGVLVTGSNSVWNCANGLELGYAGSGNSLVISNGGMVADADAVVGDNYSGGNSALITGAGSVWNAGSCTIGTLGGNNKITINKGGRMVSDFASLGVWGPATNNSVLVSDAGSVWDDSAVASDIVFGGTGSGNSLVVTNGGQVLGYYAYFGRNGADNNSALVTGPGSGFSVNCYIYTGNQGSGNTFTVANGAAVSDKFCYISYEAGSSSNAVLITGTNSSWQNSQSVFVGFDGVAGSLTISNGGTMGVNEDGVLGQDATSSNNAVLVTGGGSVWNCSGNVYAGNEGPANSLVISNRGWVIDQAGALGFSPGSGSNNVMVTGTGSVWTNSNDVTVGYYGAFNSLVISNGGQVIDYDGWLAYDADSYNNQVLVAGAGSVWTNYDDVIVGNSGAGNNLVVSNGGWVIDYDGWLGAVTNGSCYNQALVTGAGSVWSNYDAVLIGDYGVSNSLVIGNGGLVVDYWGLVGEDDSGSNNTVIVEPGGVWLNQQLAVGDLGSQNTLFVEGGSVSATNMVVGYNPLYCNDLVQMDSGQVTVTNTTASGVLEVYDGVFVLNGGTLRVDKLIVTNDCAQFVHAGGTLIYRTLMLNPNESAVGDGIPNWWKLQYGFDPLDPTVAGADPDHDGENNLAEYLAGTNPTNAASVFHIISAAKTNMDVRVTWSTVGGHSYVLQTNDNLGAGTFADFGHVISAGGTNEGTTNYLDPGAATNYPSRYYRIRLVLP